MGVTAGKNQILTFSDQDEVGGQTFNKFPETDAEVGQFWSEVWEAIVGGITAPAPGGPTAGDFSGSVGLFASTMAGVASVPGGGAAAMDVAAVAAFTLLISGFTPGTVLVPPPAPFLATLTPAIASFIIAGTADPVDSATAFSGAFGTWLGLGKWSQPPAIPAVTPIIVAP